jgi:hypothetical protein
MPLRRAAEIIRAIESLLADGSEAERERLWEFLDNRFIAPNCAAMKLLLDKYRNDDLADLSRLHESELREIVRRFVEVTEKGIDEIEAKVPRKGKGTKVRNEEVFRLHGEGFDLKQIREQLKEKHSSLTVRAIRELLRRHGKL